MPRNAGFSTLALQFYNLEKAQVLVKQWIYHIDIFSIEYVAANRLLPVIKKTLSVPKYKNVF